VPFIDNNYTFQFVCKETFKTRVIVFGVFSPLFGMWMAYIAWKGQEKKYG